MELRLNEQQQPLYKGAKGNLYIEGKVVCIPLRKGKYIKFSSSMDLFFTLGALKILDQNIGINCCAVNNDGDGSRMKSGVQDLFDAMQTQIQIATEQNRRFAFVPFNGVGIGHGSHNELYVYDCQFKKYSIINSMENDLKRSQSPWAKHLAELQEKPINFYTKNQQFEKSNVCAVCVAMNMAQLSQENMTIETLPCIADLEMQARLTEFVFWVLRSYFKDDNLDIIENCPTWLLDNNISNQEKDIKISLFKSGVKNQKEYFQEIKKLMARKVELKTQVQQKKIKQQIIPKLEKISKQINTSKQTNLISLKNKTQGRVQQQNKLPPIIKNTQQKQRHYQVRSGQKYSSYKLQITKNVNLEERKVNLARTKLPSITLQQQKNPQMSEDLLQKGQKITNTEKLPQSINQKQVRVIRIKKKNNRSKETQYLAIKDNRILDLSVRMYKDSYMIGNSDNKPTPKISGKRKNKITYKRLK